VLVAGSGAAAAVEAAATLILAIVVAVAAVTVAGLAAAVVLLRRHSRRGAEQFTMQAAALRAEVEGRTAAAALPASSAVHYHLHLSPGMDAAGIIAALPQQRDAITITRKESDMGFLVKKIQSEPECQDRSERDLPPEPVVLAPKCRDEAYLTVQGGLKWDREHGIDPG